jgi:hypothetical protein
VDDLELGITEDFETGWPLISTQLSGLTAGITETFSGTGWLTAALTIDSTPTYIAGANETFSGWNSFTDELGVTVAAEFTTADGLGTNAERFGDDPGLVDAQAVTPAHFVAIWTTPIPPAGTYRLNTGKNVVTVEADGLIVQDALAIDLETQINAAADGVSALAVGGRVRIWRPDGAQFTVLPEASDGAPFNELTVVLAIDDPFLAGYWTGVPEP